MPADQTAPTTADVLALLARVAELEATLEEVFDMHEAGEIECKDLSAWLRMMEARKVVDMQQGGEDVPF